MTIRAHAAIAIPIALLGIAVRILHLQMVRDTVLVDLHRAFAESDMSMFDQWARHIAGGDWLGREVYHPIYGWQLASAPVEAWTRQYGDTPVFYKAPFYPYLIALLYRLFGQAMMPLALLQILACAASILLLFRVTARTFGLAAAVGASLILALYAPDVHYSVAMLRGPWIVLASLLVTDALGRLQARATVGQAFVSGVMVGASLLVNEGFLMLPALVIAATLGMFAGRALPLVGAQLGGLALAYAPVVVHNLLVGAPPTALAVTGSIIYAVFNVAGSSPFFFDVRPSAFMPAIDPHGALLPTALACLRSFSGPGAVILFYLGKALGLVVPFENPDNVNFYYAALKDPLLKALPGYALLLPLAAVGMAFSWRRRRRLWPLLPLVLSLLASTLLTLPLSRYRAVIAVYLMPFAGLALARARVWIRRRKSRPLLAAAAAAVLVWVAARTLQQEVVFADRPAAAILYRPPEFLLGVQFYAKHGRPRAAVAEALELARLHPDPGAKALGFVTAGDLYAGPLRDPVAAREQYQKAEAVARTEEQKAVARARLQSLANGPP